MSRVISASGGKENPFGDFPDLALAGASGEAATMGSSAGTAAVAFFVVEEVLLDPFALTLVGMVLSLTISTAGGCGPSPCSRARGPQRRGVCAPIRGRPNWPAVYKARHTAQGGNGAEVS